MTRAKIVKAIQTSSSREVMNMDFSIMFPIFFVLVCGSWMAYIRKGSGPPIVLVHGLGTGGYHWFANIDYLSQYFTVYAPSLLGCDKSDKPDIDYSFGTMVQMTSEFLNAVQIERCALIGHSYGGAIVAQVAHDHPNRVRRLVLVDSLGLGREMSISLWLAKTLKLHHLTMLLGNQHSPTHQWVLQMERQMMERSGIPCRKEIPTLIERTQVREERIANLRMTQAVVGIAGQRIDIWPQLAATSHIPTLLM